MEPEPIPPKSQNRKFVSKEKNGMIILPIVTAVLCGIAFFLMLRDISEHKDLFLLQGDAKPERLLSKGATVYCSILIVITVAASVLFCTIYKENGILMSIKRLALLSLLWPIAYIDYKTYRIPNAFIVLGLGYRLIIFALELILSSQPIWPTVIGELIAAGALFLASVLCALLSKNSIGFGDMKLFVVMGLMLGMDGIWSAVFLTLIVSFFISAYVLITKKKTRKDTIPFGPAIVIGTYLSVCLSGM